MSGAKASFLAEYCAARGQSFVRFDYSGHGKSGGDFLLGTIGGWKEDALEIFDHIAGGGNSNGEVVLVGSSMGAWLALLIAMERRARVQAIIGIAAACDFTERLIWNALSEQDKQTILTEKIYYAPSCYGEEPYPITLNLIEEGRKHLLLDKPVIDVSCPVHLLHGTDDADVPLAIAQEIMSKLAGKDHSSLTVISGGDHRLSKAKELEMLSLVLGKALS